MKKLIDKLFSYQAVRFLFVGGLNTIVGYGIYALLVYIGINYLVSNTISTIVGVTHSYLWNRYFTFKSKNKALKEITKFVSVYVVSYLIGMCTLYIFKDKLNISPYLAGLINLVITTLISYFGHKYISFKDGNMNIKDKFLKIDRGPSKLEWTLLIIVLVFCYLSFNHLDIAQTSLHGKDLLTCILNGNFFKFYDYTNATAVYLIPIYIIFAIWSIPVALVSNIFNISIASSDKFPEIGYVLLMWYKLLPTIFTLLTAKILVKIGEEMNLSEIKRKWIPFIFLSFPPLIFSQFIFGQYDSICMFFTTLSIYYFIKKDYMKFSLIMSLAITFKLFPIFVFIPLILLSQKKIIDIIKHMIIGISGYVICNLLFITSPGFMEAKKFTDNMIDRFFASGIELYSGVLSLFLITFMGICVYAYTKKIKEENKVEFIANTIYISVVSYSAFFMFVLWHPQWIIIIVPFLILLLFISNQEKATFILYLVISIGYLLLVFHVFKTNVDERLINQGIFPEIFNKIIPREGKLENILIKIFKENVANFCTILFSGPMIINLIINYPSASKIKVIEGKLKEKTFKSEKGYILMQILPIIFLYILPTLYIYFIYYK